MAGEDNLEQITWAAKDTRTLIEQLPAGRERSLALTKLDEAVMWAEKAGA